MPLLPQPVPLDAEGKPVFFEEDGVRRGRGGEDSDESGSEDDADMRRWGRRGRGARSAGGAPSVGMMSVGGRTVSAVSVAKSLAEKRCAGAAEGRWVCGRYAATRRMGDAGRSPLPAGKPSRASASSSSTAGSSTSPNRRRAVRASRPRCADLLGPSAECRLTDSAVALLADVKGKSKLEPYAYWPLDRKLLNRRRSKAKTGKEGLARVVSAARGGVTKGKKTSQVHQKKGKRG